MPRDLYIGSLFEIGNVFNEDGTAMEQAPYVTLHDKGRNEYYVADAVTPDNGDYYAAFTKEVTKKMNDDTVLALEIFENDTMARCVKYDPNYAVARKVSATPGQINAS